MRAGVIVFPGTNCDRDTLEACQEFGWEAEYIWHNNPTSLALTPSPLRGEGWGEGACSQRKLFHPHPEFQALVPCAEIHPSSLKWAGRDADSGNESDNSLNKFDVIFIPGGFSYGDYVRSGALAKFSPVIEALKDYIENKRGFVVGICNGFQILCEAGILPGALTHNENLKFICKDVELGLGKRAGNYKLPCHCEERGMSDAAIQGINEENDDWIASLHFSNAPRNDMNCDASLFTPHSSLLTLPIAHAEGRYVADEKTIQELKEKNMIFLTYKDNPNGSVENIAGLYDKERRIIGMMPHPERAFFKELGNLDGQVIFEFIEHEFA